ncbi:Sm-like ribonucleoprotein [Ramaria rubella]|nr:Sm-like ribonucleoprotein [Ramaria rubella]
MSGRQQRVMVQPINLIFKNLQQRTKISVWLYDNIEMRIEGRIIGFDEFMNLVIDEAEEVYVKDAKPRVSLGRILLKGDNITLIQQIV